MDKTIEQIKKEYPELIHQKQEGHHFVGYGDKKTMIFRIQGAGKTESEAWRNAYKFLNDKK